MQANQVNPSNGNVYNMVNDAMHQQQLALEKKMYDGGVRAWLAAQERNAAEGSASNAAWNRRLMQYLVQPLADAISVYLEELEGKRGRRSVGAYILKVVDARVASYISIKTILDSVTSCKANVPVTQLAIQIGARIEDNIRFTRLEDVAEGYIERVLDNLKKAFSHQYRHQANVMRAAERKLLEAAKSGNSAYAIELEDWISWTSENKVQVGMLILDLATRCLLIDGHEFLALNRSEHFDSVQGKREAVTISLSSEASDWCVKYKDEVSKLFPQFAPCVVRPRDWSTPFNGGYYTPEVSSRLPLIKSGRYSHRKRLTKEQMPEVYSAVNAIQGTEWKINTDLLTVVKELFNSKKEFSVIPSRNAIEPPVCPIAEEFSGLRGKALQAVLDDAQKEEFAQWKTNKRECIEAENTRRSRLNKFASVMQQGIEYAMYDKIYFVWNVDARGRVYCNSSRVTPQGDDLGKALLLFANGTKLGKHGRKWLAVHGMGVWAEAVPNSDKKGDKISIDKRVEAVQLMQEDILSYASMPSVFTGWMQADKPWGFLAWCIEWAKLIEWEEAGNSAEEFESRIAVALDGSCSGIQHYSAMLRDSIGGKFVNLTAEVEQQDIYGEVARKTINKLNAIIQGLHTVESKSLEGVDQAKLAKYWLEYGITRSFCKKPVMTLPYGSTMLTARDTFDTDVRDRISAAKEEARRNGVPYICPLPFNPLSETTEGKEEYKKALSLITSVIWREIGETVPAARSAMKFIKKIAGKLAANDCPMYWTTPTGFIVEEVKFQTEKLRIDTVLLGCFRPTLQRATSELDINEMQGASAPDFIHSHDASHLVKVRNAATEAGISDLALIHDSFGAPAGRTEELFSILRQTFIDMYSGYNPLQSLKDSAELALGEELDVEVPEFGNLDLHGMMQSMYAFI